MNDRANESMAAARTFVDGAQDLAGRAGAYVQARMDDVSERAQSLARDANGRVVELTGRPIESWSREAQRFVRDHPLQAIAFTIGFGYILGKLMSSRG